MQFQVVVGLDLSEEGASGLGKGEPEFDLVRQAVPSLVRFDVHLDVESALQALGVDLHGGQLIVHEVVSDQGVVGPWEVSPGINLDTFGL